MRAGERAAGARTCSGCGWFRPAEATGRAGVCGLAMRRYPLKGDGSARRVTVADAKTEGCNGWSARGEGAR